MVEKDEATRIDLGDDLISIPAAKKEINPDRDEATFILNPPSDLQFQNTSQTSAPPNLEKGSDQKTSITIDSPKSSPWLEQKLAYDALKKEIAQGKSVQDCPESKEQNDERLRAALDGLINLADKDWYDLGISFFQMECFDIADLCLEKAIFETTQFGEMPEEVFLTSVQIIKSAIALHRGNPHLALQTLESLYRNQDLGNSQRIEILYWMGRASELLEKNSEALFRYEEILKNSPYPPKDVEIRIKALRGML